MEATAFNSKNLSFDANTKRVSYEGKPLRIKTGEIILSEGGILPYINPTTKQPFYEYPNGKDDYRRYSISIPLEGQLKKTITKIDSFMKTIPTDGKHEYHKLIREGKPDSKYNQKDKITVKFPSDFITKKILTMVYKDTGGKIKEAPVDKFSDLEEMITYGTTVNMVIRIKKVWETETKYGVRIECEQLLITDRPKEKIECAFV